MTIMWNKHLLHYDSTRDIQEFKEFTCFPNDIPFNYGSLTAWRTSFRPWLGPKDTLDFNVPGWNVSPLRGNIKTRRNGEIRQERGIRANRICDWLWCHAINWQCFSLVVARSMSWDLTLRGLTDSVVKDDFGSLPRITGQEVSFHGQNPTVQNNVKWANNDVMCNLISN